MSKKLQRIGFLITFFLRIRNFAYDMESTAKPLELPNGN